MPGAVITLDVWLRFCTFFSNRIGIAARSDNTKLCGRRNALLACHVTWQAQYLVRFLQGWQVILCGRCSISVVPRSVFLLVQESQTSLPEVSQKSVSVKRVSLQERPARVSEKSVMTTKSQKRVPYECPA